MAKKAKVQNKNNCPACGKGKLSNKSIARTLELDGAPKLDFEILAEVCKKCGEEFVTEENVARANSFFLAKLVGFYLREPQRLPGKVATWIRKEILLSARELSKLAGLKESTLSHANSNNSFLDRFAATILLLLANDKVRGTNTGESVTRNLNNLENFWVKVLPTAEIVEQIRTKTENVAVRWERMRKRKPNVAYVNKPESRKKKASAYFSPQLAANQSPYSTKKQSHRR